MMRGDVPEGPGTREDHGEARHDVANSMEGAALPGVPPVDGTVKVRSSRGGFLSGELGPDARLWDRIEE